VATPGAVTQPGAAASAAQGSSPAAPVVVASIPRDTRWQELEGTIQSTMGDVVILKSSDQRLIPVDVSSIKQQMPLAYMPGATLRVYGWPMESNFKAVGFIYSDITPVLKQQGHPGGEGSTAVPRGGAPARPIFRR
jgi:hypothetical protein